MRLFLPNIKSFGTESLFISSPQSSPNHSSSCATVMYLHRKTSTLSSPSKPNHLLGKKCTWPFRIYEPHSYAWRQGDLILAVMLPRLVKSHVVRCCPCVMTHEWMNLTVAGKFKLKWLDEWKLNCVYLLYRSYITCGQSPDDDDTAETWREAVPGPRYHNNRFWSAVVARRPSSNLANLIKTRVYQNDCGGEREGEGRLAVATTTGELLRGRVAHSPRNK